MPPLRLTNAEVPTFTNSEKVVGQSIMKIIEGIHGRIIFASFAIVKFSVAADSIANFGIGNILRHWGVTFIGNFIGGGLLIGMLYAFLNKNEDTYVD